MSPSPELEGSLRVGPAGWSYADWEGVVYPRPKPRSFHAIPYLAQFFGTIEINSSFYADPRVVHSTRWRDLVEDLDGFLFTAKLNRAFTHEDLEDQASFDGRVASFDRGLHPIADRLGALLVQFPLSFHDGRSSRHRLDRIREAFGHYPLVLELRHSGWFEREALRYIEDSGFSLAAIDLPWSKQHPPLDAPTVGPVGYLRLHGRNATTWFDAKAGRDQRYDYLYTPDELEGIVRRAKSIAGNSEVTFVVTNNHYTGKAVANALEITYRMVGSAIPAPSTLVESYPHLRPMTLDRGQQSLF